VKLTEKQTEAFKVATSGDYSVVIFGGSIRGGKTWWLLSTMLYLCLTHAKSRYVVIRRSLPDLKRNTFPSIQELLDRYFMSAVSDWNHDTQVITFINGSQLMFMAESFNEDKDLNRFKGLEVNGFGFEEINECQKATFHKAIERSGTWLNSPSNPPTVILATLNPAQNWTKDEFYLPFVEGTLNERWKFIVSKITDNPHIPEQYKENLKMLSPIEYARFVEGDWDAVEGSENPFLWAWDEAKHVQHNIKHNPSLLTYFSVDFNVTPLCCLVIQHHGRQAWVVDEFAISPGSIEALCDRIAAYGVPTGMIRITGDAMGNGRTLQQRDNSSHYLTIKKLLKLNDKQIIIPANPTHKNSRVDCNAALMKLDIKVSNSCKGFILDASQVECDSEGSIIKQNRKIITQRADLLDCFRYFVNAILKRYL
jgi:PBSX family phage terminase large subunit